MFLCLDVLMKVVDVFVLLGYGNLSDMATAAVVTSQVHQGVKEVS